MNSLKTQAPPRTALWRRPFAPYAGIPLLALFCLLVIELFNHKAFTEGLSDFLAFVKGEPLALCVNFLIIFITFAPAFFFRRRLFYCVLAAAVWLIAGCANGFILLNRMTPFTTADLSMIKSGIDMLPNYFSLPGIILLVLAIVLLLTLLVFLFLKGPRSPQPRRVRLLSGFCALALSGALFTGFYALAFHTHQLTDVFSNLAFAYEDYGFSYCFLQTWLNKGIRRPDNYSASAVDAVREKADALSSAAPQTDVNVIFVQLESFIDPEEIEGLTLSEEAVPNWKSLSDNFSSGYLTVPVVGAGTANTECEVLTGMSTRMFGPGEYPYKTCLRQQTVESLAYNLKENGYTAHAIHNYSATFYNRHEVYAHLGFDDFTSLEYMSDVEKTPNNWYKDDVLTEYMINALNTTPETPDFVFTVSVQGHGKYPLESVLEAPAVKVTACPDEELLSAYEYYVNQVHEMDAFIGQLVEELSAREEKTVLVLYGDHLPVLQLEARDMRSGSLFKTQYVIWDNFGLEQTDQELFAYELAAQVLGRLDISTGLFNRYHQAESESLTYRKGLRLLQYDALYGQGFLYDGASPYTPSELVMGMEPIDVTGIAATRNGWLISGKNFTPYCQVESGGRTLETEYITSYLLKVLDDPETTTPSDLSIRVVDKHNTILSDAE